MKFYIALLLLFTSSSLIYAQDNTAYGTGALSQISSPKFAIQTLQVTNPGSYSRPTIDMGSHTVQWIDQYIDVGQFGVNIWGYFSSSTDLGTFVPSVVGGHGSGATVSMYLFDYDGVNYYYEVYSASQGVGYCPQVSLSSSTGSSFSIGSYIDGNGELEVYYYDNNKTNLYSVAPTVSVSFGSASINAVLEGTAANGQNTAVGYQALYNNESSNNIGLGFKSGFDLTKGKNNTFLGSYSGRGITEGSGNTILGSSIANLPYNLNNSILLADGNGISRLFINSTGNMLLGYDNNFNSTSYRLDVNGSSRFNGSISSNSWDTFLSSGNQTNKVIVTNNINQVIQAPTSNVFNDLLAFNRKGYEIKFETSQNKVDFQDGIVNMNLFSNKWGTEAQQQVIDGSVIKAVRWTWAGVMWSNASWLALDYGYTTGSNVTIKIEQSSDNLSWIEIHQSNSNLSTSGFTNYHFINFNAVNNYIRLSIIHNYGNFVNLSGIRLLTNRLGNQGSAPEYSTPYTWNKEGWIGINKGLAEPVFPLDVDGTTNLNGSIFIKDPPASSGEYSLLARNSTSGALEKLGVNLPTSGGFDLQSVVDRGLRTLTRIEIGEGLQSTTNAPMLKLRGANVPVSSGDGTLSIYSSTWDPIDKGVNTGGSISFGGQSWTGSAGNSVMWGGIAGLKEDIIGNYNGYLALYTSAHNGSTLEKMRISSSGNVGIGTTSPEGKLNIKIDPGSPNGTVALKIGSVDNYPSLELGVENSHDAQIRTYGNDLNLYAGHWRNLGTVSTENHSMKFYTSKTGSDNWGSPKMILNHEGFLGIGTLSPSEQLSVNGKIRAKEVKVEPTSGWPDYVFEDDYELTSLKNLALFINKYKRLPEIPSAKEVEQNGVELGEMNKLLLKKIEELTLHLIEKDAQVQSLEKRLSRLEQKDVSNK